MGIQKLRQDAVAMGKLYFGSEADVGLERSAAGIVQVLGSNGAAPGTIAVGVIQGATLTTATLTSPTVNGGTLNMQDGRVRVGTVVGALGTTSVLPTNVPGLIRVGHSVGTAQLGFVHNGTTFVLEGTADGAVTMRVNPAGT